MLIFRFKCQENPMMAEAIFGTPKYCLAYYYARVYMVLDLSKTNNWYSRPEVLQDVLQG